MTRQHSNALAGGVLLRHSIRRRRSREYQQRPQETNVVGVSAENKITTKKPVRPMQRPHLTHHRGFYEW